MAGKITLEELAAAFTDPRGDHPGRRGSQHPRKGGTAKKLGPKRGLTGPGSKWYRRMAALDRLSTTEA